MQEERKSLTVYKASAGSGKTFTLATEYITLLIANPMAYRSILAVTFTNKATEEMKFRILSQLYGIWQSLPESDDYLHVVMRALSDYGERMIRERAGMALNNLLHNYNYFRVETIDSFFQSVLRNLARELDLTPNLRVGLNDIQVEEQAVDAIIEDLDESKETLQRVMQYVQGNIAEDKNWNVIGQIKEFGRTIFQDFYRSRSNLLVAKMEERGFFDNFIRQLKQLRDAAEDEMKAIGDDFFDTIHSNDLVSSDFSYADKGVFNFFVKLRNGIFSPDIVNTRVNDCLADAAKWVKKTHNRREQIMFLVETRLMLLLDKAVDKIAGCWCQYKSADLTLAHLNQLRMLGTIERKVRETNEAHERFLLSDTQHLLHSLIEDSDSPFVFEKIGARMEHVMIDEFQDTGSTQWRNFKILLQECMSHAGTRNLIVGDVKQSIYRWRSGDWRILNAIDQEFSDARQRLDIRSLDTNYRSSRNIIAFNNAFFTKAIELESEAQAEVSEQAAEQLRYAYADVCQQIPDSREASGNIEITLLPADDYEELTMRQLVDCVSGLIHKGVSISDIAILVRMNKHIPLIADYFAEYLPEVKVVSDDAFRLDSSTAVCLIVNAMRVMAHPNDYLCRAALASAYQMDVLGRKKTLDTCLLNEGANVDSLLPDGWADLVGRQAYLSLYELSECIYQMFSLDRIHSQTAYICAFYDHLAKYSDDGTPTLSGFVDEWDKHIHEKTIRETSVDGIRIVSIHKSKGLEFGHVFIPFCDWQLEKTNGNIIWCSPTDYPYCELPFIPVDYSRRALVGTIFEQDYQREYLQNSVDNLNLLYVAFTRARNGLYVIGKRGSTNSRSSLIEACLPSLAASIHDAMLDGEESDDAPLTFKWVNEPQSSKEEQTKDDVVEYASEMGEASRKENVFLYTPKPLSVDIMHFKEKPEFRQSNASASFVEGEEVEDGNDYITIGSILHKLFSLIRTTDDINATLLQLRMDGVIADDSLADKIRDMMHKRLTDKRVAEWFVPRWTLFNECSVLDYDKTSNKVINRRPDRVMVDGDRALVVDFKFGKPRVEYHNQVNEYKELLMRMGYHSVEGYIWYVYSNKIEVV